MLGRPQGEAAKSVISGENAHQWHLGAAFPG
jgi:hypothetical protein